MREKIEKIPRVAVSVMNGANLLRVAAGTNGHKGGDGGHGGVTYFALEDAGGTAIEVTPLDDGVEVVVRGDSELDTLIEALDFAAGTLEKQSGYVPKGDDLPEKAAMELEVLRGELLDLSHAAWHQRESKSGAKPLRELAARIALTAKRLESLVKEHTFSA
jgi:hypothetical protein